MEWVGINNLGCTWEPKAQFVGTVVEATFQELVWLKEAKAEMAEHKRKYVVASKLVVTGKPCDVPGTCEPPSKRLVKELFFCVSRSSKYINYCMGPF